MRRRRMRRRRGYGACGTNPMSRHIGEAHPLAKLDRAKVSEARALRAGGMGYKEIAARYGVGLSVMWNAVNKFTWK